jgi:hypothetical protein
MRVYSFILSVLLVVSCNLHPANSNRLHSSSAVTVEMQEGKVLIDYLLPFSSFDVKTAWLDGAEWSEVIIEGFESTALAGTPDIPSQTLIVRLPEGKGLKEPVITVYNKEGRVLENKLKFREFSSHSVGKADLTAYQKVAGEDMAVIEEVSYAGSERFALVKIYPVKYEPPYVIEIIKKAHIEFQFIDVAVEPPPVGKFTGYSKYLAVNPDLAYVDVNRFDLLIIHESFKEASQRLINFKRMLGREVKDIYVSNRTAEQIKAIMQEEYKQPNPPGHTLFIGNINHIPAWRGSGDNTWTDYPYQTLKGNLPDVSMGRVPAMDVAEFDRWLDKHISRELFITNNDDVLLTAGRDTRMGCPTNARRIGQKIQPGSSSIKLTEKFRTQVGTDDVIKSYNESPNLVFYDGHGNQQGMTEIPLTNSNLNRLTNKGFFIVFDIACLNANWSRGAAARNFAETLLLMENAGAAGIMASGGSGYGHDFFQTIGNYLAQARLEVASLGDSPLNYVGLTVMMGKIKHGSQDRSFWNYYGDPASTLWSRQH